LADFPIATSDGPGGSLGGGATRLGGPFTLFLGRESASRPKIADAKRRAAVAAPVAGFT
jgi:hypothetical protein